MISLEQQIINFLVTVGLGLVMGAIFDFYYVLRCLFRPRKIFVHICDFFIWLFMIAFVFITLVYVNWGEIRFYVFLGIILGTLIYYLAFSKYIKIIYKHIIKTILKILYIIKSIVLFPFKLVAKGLLYLVGIIYMFFMWCTKPLRNFIVKSRVFVKLKELKAAISRVITRLKKNDDPFE